MSRKRKRTSAHQIPDLRVGTLSFRICFCQSQECAAGVYLRPCVGRWCSGRRNEGDGSERTQGDKATRIRAQWRQAAQGEAVSSNAAPARSSTKVVSETSAFKKTKGNYGPARNRFIFPRCGVCPFFFSATPHRGKKGGKMPVNNGSSGSPPCAAPLVESRNGTRGTKPPRPAASPV